MGCWRSKRRCLAFGLALLACGGSALAADGASPVLVTERVVAEATATNASAARVRDPGGLNGLPDTPLARDLAEVLVELARGREERARRVGLEALEEAESGDASAPLRAALVRSLVEAGLGERGRRWLLEGKDPVAQAGWALQLARDGRCDAAVTRADHLVKRPPGPTPARLMVARALQLCGEPRQALGLMYTSAVGAEAIDPRIALSLGELAFELGDADSAHWWCQRAARDGPDLPSVVTSARVCAAAADAVRGVLPAARRELIQAWADRLEVPFLPLRERRDAAIGAAWVAVSAGGPDTARQALEVLDTAAEVAGLSTRGMPAALRAMALVGLERVREARRALRRAGGEGEGAAGEVLAAIAEARILMRENDEVAASARLGEAADAARRSIRQDLNAVVEMERARLARWTGRQPAVRMHVMGALRAWREGATSPTRRPIVDPVLPRRALEWAVAEDWTGTPSGRRAEVLLEVAAEAQRALAPSPLGINEIVDPGRVRRLLAARNASLLYYAIGESRSFAWLVEPSGVRGAELPSGGELARRAGLSDGAQEGPLASIEGLYGGLLETVRPGSNLMVRPDGVLYALSWRGLPSPTIWQSAGPTIGQAVTLAIVPDLDTAVDPRRTPMPKAAGRERVIAVFASNAQREIDGLTGSSTEGVDWRPVVLGPGSGSDALARIRDGDGVLFIALPLLSAGAGGSGVLFGVPSGGDGSVRPLALDELIAPRSRYQLVCIAPDPRWPSPPAARARAGAAATRLGVRTSVLPLQTIGDGLWSGFWNRFLAQVSRGTGEARALSTAAPRGPDGRRSHLPEFLVVGQANRVVAEAGGAGWRFWLPLAAGVLLVVAVIVRALWPKKDPFGAEPPED